MARIVRDHIDHWFEYGLDMDNRTIYLGSASYDMDGGESGVDHLMAEFFIKSIHMLEKASSSAEKPILVIMNNPGGDWYHGMAIFDAIRACKNHVTVKVFGHAMSMGSIILQAADERVMSVNSKFMIHYGYDGAYNHSKIFSKWSDEGKKINYVMENIYLDDMMEKDRIMIESGQENYLETILANIINKQKELEYPTPKKVKYHFSKEPEKRREDVRKILIEMLNFDTILTAQETVDIGLADKILEDKVQE